MFKVREKLCINCGACIEVCPTGAIFIVNNKTQINPSLCTMCYNCIQVCPKGAIGAEVSVPTSATSTYQLRLDLLNLKNQLQILNQRLRKLELMPR